MERAWRAAAGKTGLTVPWTQESIGLRTVETAEVSECGPWGVGSRKAARGRRRSRRPTGRGNGLLKQPCQRQSPIDDPDPGFDPLGEVGEPSQRVVHIPEPSVNNRLQARLDGDEGGGQNQGCEDDGGVRPLPGESHEHFLKQADRTRVQPGESGGQRAILQGAVDDQVDLVETVPKDGDRQGHGNDGDREPPERGARTTGGRLC